MERWWHADMNAVHELRRAISGLLFIYKSLKFSHQTDYRLTRV